MDDPNESVERTVSITSPSVGGFLPAIQYAVTRRRQGRLQDFVEVTANQAGVAAETVIARLAAEEDDVGTSLLEQAADAALRTADRRKIRSLARVAAAAVSGDDARIDISLLVLPALLQIEAPHVRLLQILMSGRASVRDLSTRLGLNVTTLWPLLAPLEAVGVIERMAPIVNDRSNTVWSTTEFAGLVWDYLVDYQS